MKRLSIILALLLAISAFSGCSNEINVSDMAIVQAVGIDKAKNGVLLTIQYLDLAKSTGATDNMSENITSVASGKGRSIGEAVSDTALNISSSIFFGQNKLIVLGSSYAKDSMANSLDYLLRGVDSRPDVLVALADKSAKEIVSNPERKARIPAENIFNLLENGEKNSVASTVNVNDLLSAFCDKFGDMYMPILTSNDDFVSLKGIAIFSDNRYATTLPLGYSLGFLIARNDVEKGFLAINDNKLGKVGINISKCKTKNQLYAQGDRLHFKSNVCVKFVLNDVENGVTNKISSEDASRLEADISNRIKAMCIASVNECFLNGSDPFLIAHYLARYDNNLFEKSKENWRKNLPKIVYTADVDAQLILVSNNSVS